MLKMALSDELATELEYIWAEIGRPRLYCASSLEDENPEKDEIRKAYIYGRQRKAVPIGILSPWWEKSIECRASKGKVVTPFSSLVATHVSENWEIPSFCESNFPTELEYIWAGKGRSRLYCASSQETRRRTHPGKHGHNDGSNAFRNWAQGGDGSGVERTIQDDWGSTNTTVNRSVQMISPPTKRTPQTPPSPTRRAAPQVQPAAMPTPQVQPPAMPAPQVQPAAMPAPQVQPPAAAAAASPPPTPPPGPPRAVGWFNFNVAGLAEIFLGISLTIVLAAPQILHSGGNSLSASDRKLLFGSQLFSFAGFILCLLAYIVQVDRAAKLLIAFGVVANIFGLLLIVALGR